MWDFPIQTDKTFEHNHLDLTFIDKKRKKCLLLNPPCPPDIHTERKEEKCSSYSELQYEIARIWKTRKVEAIPVVIGALQTVKKHFKK